MEYLNWKIDNKVATITINRPPANALSSGLIEELGEVLDQLSQTKILG